MPLRKDEQGGGTEQDGSRSEKYCSHCYVQGQFTLPEISVDEMRQRVIVKLRESHFPLVVARWMTHNLPELERWRKQL